MQQRGRKNNKWMAKDIAFILLSVAVSYWLSLTNPQINNMEMAAILNYFLPGIAGLLFLFTYLIIYWFFRKFYSSNVLLLVALFCLISILIGAGLHYYGG